MLFTICAINGNEYTWEYADNLFWFIAAAFENASARVHQYDFYQLKRELIMPKLFQLLLIIVGSLCIISFLGSHAEGAISDETSECLDCHASIHPGIVKEWRNSRHAATTPGEAMKIKGNARIISSPDIPETRRAAKIRP